jgi:hypothetical protein
MSPQVLFAFATFLFEFIGWYYNSQMETMQEDYLWSLDDEAFVLN